MGSFLAENHANNLYHTRGDVRTYPFLLLKCLFLDVQRVLHVVNFQLFLHLLIVQLYMEVYIIIAKVNHVSNYNVYMIDLSKSKSPV